MHRARIFCLLALPACLFLAQLLAASEIESPRVRANGEQLQGSWSGSENRIAQFLGIPFAAAPVADARWRAPRQHVPRTGIQNADTFAPACMQGTGGVDWYVRVAAAFGHGPEVVGRPEGLSEDCLYLNVWSPRLDDAAGLPVMVYVHGGSNSGGWSYEPNYLGMNLAARNVVVVTIAYRLGPFGFFAHPALSNGGNEPEANFALLDIRAAFAWVQENIASFGGDASNITAFGESAGAINIIDMLLQDTASGDTAASPFRRLISQSIGGSLGDRQTLAVEQATGEQLVSHLGLSGEVTAETLRQVPAQDLLEATSKLPATHYHDAVVDGQTLKALPLDLAKSADFSGVDIILGTNADEWLMYTSQERTQQDVDDWIARNASGQREMLLNELPANLDARHKLDRLDTAHDMLCPSRFLAAQVNKSGGRAWVYYFSRQRTGPGGDLLGAYHGAELPYVFDTHDAWISTDEADRAVTEKVLDYWVQFARNGDPNGKNGPHWPLYVKGEASVMRLDEPAGVMPPFEEKLCEVLGPGGTGGEK